MDAAVGLAISLPLPMAIFRTRSAPSAGSALRQPTPIRTPRRNKVLLFGTPFHEVRNGETRTRLNTPVESPTLHIRVNRHARHLKRNPRAIRWPYDTLLKSSVHQSTAQFPERRLSGNNLGWTILSPCDAGEDLSLLSLIS